MMVSLVNETRPMLFKHQPLLKLLRKELSVEGGINAPEMIRIARNGGG